MLPIPSMLLSLPHATKCESGFRDGGKNDLIDVFSELYDAEGYSGPSVQLQQSHLQYHHK